MTWVKVDDQFPDHPKIVQAGPLASWLYVCGLCYASRYLTNGFIPNAQVRRLADVDNAPVLAERLVELGLWESAEGGFQIHDFLEYNPTAEQVRATREERAKAGARGGKRSGESRRAQANEAKEKQLASQLVEANAKQNRTPYPIPIPIPSPSQIPIRSIQTASSSQPTDADAVAALKVLYCTLFQHAVSVKEQRVLKEHALEFTADEWRIALEAVRDRPFPVHSPAAYALKILQEEPEARSGRETNGSQRESNGRAPDSRTREEVRAARDLAAMHRYATPLDELNNVLTLRRPAVGVSTGGQAAASAVSGAT